MTTFIPLLVCLSAWMPQRDVRTMGEALNRAGADVVVLHRGESTAKCAALVVRSDNDWSNGFIVGYDDSHILTDFRASALVATWTAFYGD